MKWINFLHLYQPPSQSPEVVKAVSKESYRLIATLLETYPQVRMTLNISGSLLELLDSVGERDLIERFKKLWLAGEIELVGSAMYHPILPLIPASEITRQIDLNKQTLKKYFGETCDPKGFYLPEMAYSAHVGKVIKETGFEWIILDDEGHASKDISPKVPYEIKDIGLKVIFRNRLFSKTFPPEFIVSHMQEIKENTLITAHDGELYGHWHKDDRGFYKQIFNDKNIEMVTVSAYIASLEKKDTVIIEPHEGSWETTPEERKAGIPFSLWNNPQNRIHKKLWNFAKDAVAVINKHGKDPQQEAARVYLDKGLASCSWWWASERTLGAFSPKTWNPTEIEKGFTYLLTGIRSLNKITAKEHIRIEEKANMLRELVWKRHWQLYTKEK